MKEIIIHTGKQKVSGIITMKKENSLKKDPIKKVN